MKNKLVYKIFILLPVLLCINSCNRDDSLLDNPNTRSEESLIPPTLILNHITSNLIKSEEMPFNQAARTSQFYVSNYSYYWGANSYSWTTTDDEYDIYLYAQKMSEQAQKLGDDTRFNFYKALSNFFKAYSSIWLSQRVGDIPMKEAGNSSNLTPNYDTQKEVYKQSLDLLEEANTLLGKINTTFPNLKNTVADQTGDIFGLTYFQWQKLINTYELRILISLSKRATDTPDLNIPARFAEILTNTAQYPIMQSNNDNMLYKFNRDYNPYPIYTRRSYTYGANIGKTLLDITTSTKDPRTFIFATPAPAKYKVAGVSISDFSAYVGASTNTAQSVLFAATDTSGNTVSDKGNYSYINYKRYFSSQDGSTAEPYIVIGYPELCFNIAEAINRGWVAGDAASWYSKGINASLSFYGLTNGQSFEIGDRLGGTIGTVTINTDQFLNNSEVIYKGNNSEGLKQIILQKYVSLFCNSGYEAFYNWRRTGFPEFQQGGVGIGTPNNQLPYRWMYPQGEITYNASHYQSAIQSQYEGSDDISKLMWLLK
ncbi:SusD/RagB family nutrient-binding outer membrane lipoprotein [Chryseobacterium sp.]|uniref:SusD/RagB family nutrient-binding outer membrane lipoprotein n=1 Tax=Chryseobacterium sp. TaxID=1871047 RepID=UPI0025C29487|nr:SusD/RagB family nutrient-binding outer membrane lipoprotein [Chryseobacterium sp.]